MALEFDDEFESFIAPVESGEFDLDQFSTPVSQASPIQDVYKARLEKVQSVGRGIARLRDEAQALPEGSEQRTQLESQADEMLSVLDADRREFFERRVDDIFLESTPINRTPLAPLGFGGREFVEGQLAVGATAASMFYRAIGADSEADAVNLGMQQLRRYNDIAAKRELGPTGQLFSHVLKGLSELGPVGKAGQAAKMAPKEIGKLVAGYSAVSTVNNSLTEGAEQGKTGSDLAGYALANGAADYILGSAANEASLALGGGLGEVIMPVVSKAATKLSFGRAARDTMVTAAFEALPNAAQSLVNDGLRMVYEVGDVNAEDVLNNALLSAATGATTGAATSAVRHAGAMSENYSSIIKGWTSRLKRNLNLQDKVKNAPESVQVIQVEKGPRTTDVSSAAYGPAYQIKKLAVNELRRLPPDSPRRIGVNAHLRDAEATLSNVRRSTEGRKAASDYLERELAEVDGRLSKNEIDFITLAELENEMVLRPAIPESLQRDREKLQSNLQSMEGERSSLVSTISKKAGILEPSPEAKNAKARLAAIEPEIEQSKQALTQVDEMIRLYEGEIAATNAATRQELEGELTKLNDERNRLLQDKEIIQDEVTKIADTDSQVLKKVTAPPVDQSTKKLIDESGDIELEALRQRSTNDLREELGYDKLTTDDKISMDAALQSAVAKGIPDRALEISTVFLAERRPMTMEEVVGVGYKIKQNLVDYAAMEKASKLPVSPAAADAMDASMKQIESDIRVMTEALYHTGTDTARALAARTRQHWVSLWGPRFKARLGKLKQGDLTPEENKTVDGLISQITKLDNEIIALDPKSDAFADKTYDRQNLVKDLEWIKSKLEWNTLTKGQKVGRGLSEGLNLWRAILTSGDGVPILRQGAAMWNHPIVAAKAIPLFYKGFVNDRAAHKFDIQSKFGRRNSDLYGDRFFSDLADPLSARDEAVASSLADRVPILRNFARGYRAWVNRLRADSFDAIMEANGGRENLDDSQIGTIRETVLNMTGRGGLGGFEQSSRTLYQALIAPRWLTSRFSTAFNVPALKGLARGDTKAAYVASKEYAKMLMGLATTTYILEQMGKTFFGEENVKFVRDPSDPNFGRLQIGSQYVEATGSLAMPIRLVAAAMENLSATYTGRKRERDFEQTAVGTFTSRLAPAPSLAATLIRGEAFGEDVTPGVIAKSYAVPWPLGNAVETLKRDGFDQAVISTAMEHFGAGAFYKPPKKKNL